ncbi:MAG: hypothetical protein ACPGXY_06630, partial [Alphaproteobacteria bacterium]
WGNNKAPNFGAIDLTPYAEVTAAYFSDKKKQEKIKIYRHAALQGEPLGMALWAIESGTAYPIKQAKKLLGVEARRGSPLMQSVYPQTIFKQLQNLRPKKDRKNLTREDIEWDLNKVLALRLFYPWT